MSGRAEARRKAESGMTTREADGLAEGLQRPHGARRESRMTTRKADGLTQGMQRTDGVRGNGERWMGCRAAQQGPRGP